MSGAPVHFLSSSPSRPVATSLGPSPRNVTSSSPGLPALSDIFCKSQPSQDRVGRGADAIAGAPTSAADVLRDAAEVDIDTEAITRSPARTPTKTRKRPNVDKLPQAQSLDTAQETPILIESSPTEKPWQKFKNKESKAPRADEHQPALPKGRVTKASVAGKTRKKAPKKSETVSHHFLKDDSTGGTRPPEALPLEDAAPAEHGEVSGRLSTTPADELSTENTMEQATRRRERWTPPLTHPTLSLPSDPDNREAPSSADPTAVSQAVFKNLLGDYGHQQATTPGSSEIQHQPPDLELFKKRKLIETVSLVANQQQPTSESRQDSPPKRAPPKKRKIKTITELATAPYAAPEPDFDLTVRSQRDSLLEYFDSDGNVKALMEHQTQAMSKAESNAKGKGKKAKQPAKPKTKKQAARAPVLLSPTSALKQSKEQDFVFGTSSQLMREESPDTLRDLQAAIQASNKGDDAFGEVEAPGLWHAGSRDCDGDLLSIEVVDLSETPTGSHRMLDSNPMVDSGSGEQDISNGKGSPLRITKRADAHSMSPEKQGASGSLDPAEKDNPPQPEGPSGKESVPKPAKPDYDILTDAQLSKQIASFGFKPVKRRQAMISLLNQCWASKHEPFGAAAAAPFSTSAAPLSPRKQPVPKPDDVPQPVSPKRPRGRPRKTQDASSTSIGVETAAPQPRKKTAASVKSPAKPRGRPRKNPETSPSPVSTSAKTKASKGSKDSKQPVSPKPRGRPRKDATSRDPATVTGPAATATSAGKATIGATTPKRSPGRPKKIAPSKCEIADSDDEADLLSSSRASSADRVFSSPPQVDLSMADEAMDPLAQSSAEDQQAAKLFGHITRAVTSAPRSKDPSQPSWHESILLYDPVVLEDLTAWLNAGELDRVGYDGEVSPMDVKQWCEARSVICLWRTNLHGKERKRF